MKYRPEIDGLRAVAVIPVILFHAHLAPFSGGFIGVDIFFVISGYLITTLLIMDIERERFSIINFYERRARRILPALFFVVAACIPFAYLWMFPLELNDFSQSVVATVLFSSNILFWLESGYFAPDSGLKPLLHTWSLAIEEQYYIFFPLLLMLVWRGRRHVLIALCVIGILALMSFALMTNWRVSAPSANFYLLPTRAWELLAGSLTAIALRHFEISSQRWLSTSGIGLIGVSLFLSSEDLWPSWLTLLPVLGTVLVIVFTSPKDPVGRTLSSPLFIGVGLISYSAYLWHQPLLAFLKIRSSQEPPVWANILVVAATFLLAYLTWRFVERPFRHHGSAPPKVSRNALAIGSATVGTIFIAASLVIDATDGLPNRNAPSGQSFAAIEGRVSGGRAARLPCDTDITFKPVNTAPLDECIFKSSVGDSSRGQAILIGDSHASMLSTGLRSVLLNAGFDLSVMTYGGCMPFTGFSFSGRDCNTANQLLYRHLETAGYDLIIIAARTQYLTSDTPAHVYFEEPENASSSEQALKLIENGLARIQQLGSTIVYFDPVPEMPVDIGKYIRTEYAFSDVLEQISFAIPYTDYTARAGSTLQILDSRADEGFFRVPTSDILCTDEQECIGVENGRALYSDDNHLSQQGIERLLPAFRKILEQVP